MPAGLAAGSAGLGPGGALARRPQRVTIEPRGAPVRSDGRRRWEPLLPRRAGSVRRIPGVRVIETQRFERSGRHVVALVFAAQGLKLEGGALLDGREPNLAPDATPDLEGQEADLSVEVIPAEGPSIRTAVRVVLTHDPLPDLTP